MSNAIPTTPEAVAALEAEIEADGVTLPPELEDAHAVLQRAMEREIERLNQVLKTARRDALEEASKACAMVAQSYDNEWNRGLGVAGDLVSACEDCRDAIRALMVAEVVMEEQAR